MSVFPSQGIDPVLSGLPLILKGESWAQVLAGVVSYHDTIHLCPDGRMHRYTCRLVVRNTNMCHSVPLENNDETNLSLTSVPFLEYVVSECMYSSVYIEIIDSLSNSQILVT